MRSACCSEDRCGELPSQHLWYVFGNFKTDGKGSRKRTKVAKPPIKRPTKSKNTTGEKVAKGPS
eukprot:2337135-Amphidinium_carterae.1